MYVSISLQNIFIYIIKAYSGYLALVIQHTCKHIIDIWLLEW